MFDIVFQTEDGRWESTGQSISFKYGTVRNVLEGHTIGTIQEQKYVVQYLMFDIQGDDNATSLFEFMANSDLTSNVEWDHVKVGLDDSGRNFVGTLHYDNGTITASYLLSKNYTIRAAIHSHPKGSILPSKADSKIAQRIHARFPSAKLFIYTTNGYIGYDEHTKTK